jgi:hypothetical protein
MAKPKFRSTPSPGGFELGQIGSGYFVGGVALAVGVMVIGGLFEAYPTECRTIAIAAIIVIASRLGDRLADRLLPPLLRKIRSRDRAKRRLVDLPRGPDGFARLA